MPSFHLIDVAVIFIEPSSSRKVKVLVSLVSSKYGLGEKFWKMKRKKNYQLVHSSIKKENQIRLILPNLGQ